MSQAVWICGISYAEISWSLHSLIVSHNRLIDTDKIKNIHHILTRHQAETKTESPACRNTLSTAWVCQRKCCSVLSFQTSICTVTTEGSHWLICAPGIAALPAALHVWYAVVMNSEVLWTHAGHIKTIEAHQERRYAYMEINAFYVFFLAVMLQTA